MSVDTFARLVEGAIKIGNAVAAAFRRGKAALPKLKPRPRVHVPTQAEREAARRREHRP